MKRWIPLVVAPLLAGCDQMAVTSGGTNSTPAAVKPVADVITRESQVNAAREATDKLKAIGAEQQEQLKAAEDF